jgi:hypothetical protein
MNCISQLRKQDKAMHQSPKDKELAGDAKMFRAWKKFHRDERAAVLAGPHGIVLAELFRMFANLKQVQPAQLIGFARSVDWAAIDYNTKLVVVHELNNAITAFRIKHGLPEFDDGLPGEPDTPFRTIKMIVLMTSPHSEGALPRRSSAQVTVTAVQGVGS